VLNNLLIYASRTQNLAEALTLRSTRRNRAQFAVGPRHGGIRLLPAQGVREGRADPQRAAELGARCRAGPTIPGNEYYQLGKKEDAMVAEARAAAGQKSPDAAERAACCAELARPRRGERVVVGIVRNQ